MPRRPVLIAVVAALLAAPAPTASADPPPAGIPGRPLYVTNAASDNVSVFTLGQDGTPARAGDLVPAEHESAPSGIVLSPDARFAYVILRGTFAILPYSVGADGVLTPLSPVSTGADSGAYGIAIAPDGRSLYVADDASGTVSVFAIGDDGVPTLLGAPVETGVENPRGLAVTPDGRFLYVGHSFLHGTEPHPTDALVRFAIDGDGALGERGAPITVGGGAEAMAVSPDGRFLYVATSATDQVFGFRIGAGGDLTAVPGSPFAAVDFPDGMAMAPDGRHLFVAHPGPVRPDAERAVVAYSVGGDGALTLVEGSPFAAGQGPAGITTTPDGRFLYVSNVDSHDLSAFAVEPGGVLRTLGEAPVPTGGSRPLFQATAVLPNQGPVASFSFEAAPTGKATAFNATASADPDGAPAHYAWDFGDGTVLLDGGPNPQHAYRTPGRFTATLTVTDDEGCSTARVFTGQAALCNGSAAARTTRTVVTY